MAKLYQLSDQYRRLMDMIDDALDNEELSEDDLQMFIDTVESIEDSIAVKCENIVKLLMNLQGDVLAFKEEEKRLAKRRKYMENKVDGLKNYMDNMLRNANIDNLNAGSFTIKYHKTNPSVEIVDINKIPAQYRIKQEDKINKTDLLKALKSLKDGETIEGVKLITDKTHMRIS